jgi:cell shape-determining protein MreC
MALKLQREILNDMPNRKLIKSILPLAALSALIFFSHTSPVQFLRSSVGLALKPVMKTVSDTARKFESANSEELNGRMRAALFQIEELRGKVQELERALRFKEEIRNNLMGARVILYAEEFGKEFLILDRGRKDEVREGDLVISPDNMIVGTIREVEESISKVSLASNSGETFEVRIFPLDVQASARGLGARTFSLELIPADMPIKSGDIVIFSSNSGGVFILPEKFILGEVLREIGTDNEIFKEGRAIMLADPKRLDEVFIVKRMKSGR